MKNWPSSLMGWQTGSVAASGVCGYTEWGFPPHLTAERFAGQGPGAKRCVAYLKFMHRKLFNKLIFSTYRLFADTEATITNTGNTNEVTVWLTLCAGGILSFLSISRFFVLCLWLQKVAHNKYDSLKQCGFLCIKTCKCVYNYERLAWSPC